MPAPVSTPARLAVQGAGLIGRRHIDHIRAEPCADLAAIIDPTPSAQALAAEANTPWYPSLAAMLEHTQADGIIIATPNQLHVAHALDALAAGLPALVEKPIADDVADATILVEAFEKFGLPLLIGHHRRHNPLIQQARKTIVAGQLGEVVAVHGICWFYKPDDYFDIPWRREKGAGPILTNLIHDVDLLRYLCGEIISVQAMQSNAQRGHEVEETATILLRFETGALGTLSVSDTIVAPWSWEFTSGENPAYTNTKETCYQIGGTRGSLTVPYLDLWQNETKPSWWEPLTHTRLPVTPQDPLALQIRNLCAVIRGAEAPVVSGREGLNTLKIIAAIKQAAATATAVTLS